MAHYLAEKLLAHKQAVGEAKTAIEADLIDLILRFWKHRAYFPRGTRPFEEYEPVLRALSSLDPEQDEGRYFRHEFFENNKEIPEGPTRAWIDIAKDMDRGARAVVSLCIRQAARSADKPDDVWFSAAKVLAEDSDRDFATIKIIVAGTEDDKKEFDPIEFELGRLKKVREDLRKLIGSGSVILRLMDQRLGRSGRAGTKSKKTVPTPKAKPTSKRIAKSKSKKNRKSSGKTSKRKASKARAPSRKMAGR